jgi:alanine dehydrogenase
MRIGVPKEQKAQEYRVGLTPSAVRQLTERGHQVVVEEGAGQGSGYLDDEYRQAGASLLSGAEEVYAQAALIVKVKEPQPGEIDLLCAGQCLFCYLHLAPDIALCDDLLASGVTAIAYETITDDAGRLPLLKPMSEIAGRLSVQAGAHCLETAQGGRGVLLGAVAGLPPAKVLVLGGGVVGSQAIDVALGMGATVAVVEKQRQRRDQLAAHYNSAHLAVLAELDCEAVLPNVDMVVGAALVPGARAPQLLKRSHLPLLNAGAVLVDVAVDQGGCFESSRPTSHQQPTFIDQGIVHYCVANIPSAVSRTASLALSQATLPYVQRIASSDLPSIAATPGIRDGINIAGGAVYCPAVAEAQQRPLADLASLTA